MFYKTRNLAALSSLDFEVRAQPLAFRSSSKIPQWFSLNSKSRRCLCLQMEPVGGAARFLTAVKSKADLQPLVLFSGDIFAPSISK
jgi:hypothetical protein